MQIPQVRGGHPGAERARLAAVPGALRAGEPALRLPGAAGGPREGARRRREAAAPRDSERHLEAADGRQEARDGEGPLLPAERPAPERRDAEAGHPPVHHARLLPDGQRGEQPAPFEFGNI